MTNPNVHAMLELVERLNNCPNDAPHFMRELMDEAANVLRDASAPAAVRPRWKHKKRGTTYTEIGRGKLQSMDCGGLSDLEPMVIYQGDDGQIWVRDQVEFEDGRFEFVPLSAQTDGKSIDDK